jgi:outer membrane protein insertion porin family
LQAGAVTPRGRGGLIGLTLWPLVLLLLLPTIAAAQADLIEDIVVHRNRRIPRETIEARMFTRRGDVYNAGALERDFHALWNTGYFQDLRFERERGERGWILHVHVEEKPVIREIVYEGLNAASQSEVLERFRERKVGLSQESQYDPTRVKRAEVVLKELLAEKGRQFATIRSEVRPIPPAAVGVTFVVDEGPKVKVGNIRFHGNQNVSSRALRRAMRNLRPIGIPNSILFENLFSRTFDATKLSEDTERVRFFYQTRGYFTALVQDPQTEVRDTGGFRIPLLQKAGKAVDITVPVEEGDRYRLASINFKNHEAIRDAALLRSLFEMKDGEIFNVEHVRKGLDTMRKAYGELGHINYTSVPQTDIDEEKRFITLNIDIDEGKPFFVRRIEFQGNTTTRDKVIRRELALEEGNRYNSRLWELSVLRLNQLGYFEALQPEQDSTTRQDNQEGTVDITLRVKEKGKNSIGLTGGVSGLAGSFVGLSYETNNFLGLGETLRVEANFGSFQRNLLFGFTEPYLFDRPIQFGFTVFSRRFDFDQARQSRIFGGLGDIPEEQLDFFQNYSQSSTGFTVSTSYQLRRSFKRVGITYAYDSSSVTPFSTVSQQLFEQIAFRGLSGPDSLRGIRTSKVIPSLVHNTVDHPMRPTRGTSYFIGGDISGLGGNVRTIRPVLEFKQFRSTRRGHVLGYRVQGVFLTGYGGRVAPPFDRLFLGGENDIRGFDIRSVSPRVYLVQRVDFPLLNPDGSPVPRDPGNLRLGNITVPLPVHQLYPYPGGDTSVVANLEYRIPIAGPVSVAPFVDWGMNFITRPGQLRISDDSFAQLTQTPFGCPVLGAGGECQNGINIPFAQVLNPISGTNYVPRMSAGVELQVIMPVVNAPFRIYWAYNPMRMDTIARTPVQITRDMFPLGGRGGLQLPPGAQRLRRRLPHPGAAQDLPLHREHHLLAPTT